MHLFALNSILETYGVFGIAIIIFCETAIPFCFFFPGDTLLFTAGIFAAVGKIGIIPVISAAFVGAILGGIAGYFLGRALGSRFLHGSHSSKKLLATQRRAHAFYERYGAAAIIVGRFIPLVRTFLSGLAGAAEMRKRIFFSANAVGALLWTTIVTTIGYFLGRQFPNLVDYMAYAILVVVVLSFIPLVYHTTSIWVRKRNS